MHKKQFRVLVPLHLPLTSYRLAAYANSSDHHQRFLADLFSGRPGLTANRMTPGELNSMWRARRAHQMCVCVHVCPITACVSLTWRYCWWTCIIHVRRVLRLLRRAEGRALLHAKDIPAYEKKKQKTLGTTRWDRMETDKRTTNRKQTQTKGFD